MAYRGEMSVLNRVLYDSRVALRKLQKDGINCSENVQQFKEKIGELIQILEKEKQNDRNGRIGCHAAQLTDLQILVDELIDYNQNPTNQKAEYLRGLASTDGTITEFVKTEMNKQKDPQFRF